MTHHHYDPALEAQLDHRRATLQQDAEQHRLGRLAATTARRAADRSARPAWPARGRASRAVTGHAGA